MSGISKRGICAECKEGPKLISSIHPTTGENICRSCYRKAREKDPELVVRKERLAGRPTTASSPVFRRAAGRKENAKKPGTKAKYPTREMVIEALETREVQGKENFPKVLGIEDTPLYQTALRFGVELPGKKNPPVRYYPGDLVKNRNPKDLGVYGKIGKVVSANERVVRVDFREDGYVTRIYEKWFNINHIVLSARKTRRSVGRPPKSKALV